MEYFVERLLHNGEKDAWDYKATKKFDDIDSAKKEFHNVLSTYINYGTLDFVSVILVDKYMNVIDKEYWEKAKAE